MLNRERNVQVCDATGDDSSTAAGFIFNKNTFENLPLVFKS